MREGGPFVSVLFALSILLVAGCHRVSYYKSPPIDGLRFFATADLFRRTDDSIVVRVSTQNRASRERSLEGGICSDPLTLRLHPVSGVRRKQARWDSSAWRRATRSPQEVCLALLVRRLIPPGSSSQVAVFTLPVRAILGDSLPLGRYRFTAQLNSSGWSAGEIDAGILEIPPPLT